MSSVQQQQINQLYRLINASKMIAELQSLQQVTDKDMVAAMNVGTNDAVSVKIESLRGYLGNYNASTNSPTLADGVGLAGDWYNVTTAGSINLGSGTLDLKIGDRLFYNETTWIKLSKLQDSLIIAEGEEIITKRDGNTGNTLQQGDRVWFKKVDDNGTTITLVGNSYKGSGLPEGLYSSYNLDGIGEITE